VTSTVDRFDLISQIPGLAVCAPTALLNRQWLSCLTRTSSRPLHVRWTIVHSILHLGVIASNAEYQQFPSDWQYDNPAKIILR
jgi:hypothetical protein